jgi:diguanylate cyclase (GGDEF)-like protein
VSFRARLALFFLLIVVIPVTAIAVLVVDVTGDSQAGKADAQLSTGLEAALSLYEREVAEAEATARRLVADEEFAAAAAAGDAEAIEGTARSAASDDELVHLAVSTPAGDEVVAIGGGTPFAASTLRTTGTGGGFEVVASTSGPDGYVADVRELTGLDAALVVGNETAASTAAGEEPELPATNEATDTELDGQSVRAAAGSLPDEERSRVVLFAEVEAGGFFDSQPRVALALALFLLLAAGLIALVFRALQGQVAAMLEAAQRIGSGDFSGRVPVHGHDEMAGLAAEFNKMSDRLEDQIGLLRRQQRDLDRSVQRLGEAFAAGLDRDAVLAIVADTARSSCNADYCRIMLADGTLIEDPADVRGDARDAASAGERRSRREGARVVADRGEGHALSAPLRRLGGGRESSEGTMSVARRGLPFMDSERDVFLYLLGQAAASLENITTHEKVSEQAVTDELTGLPNSRAFRELIEREASRAERFGHELSLVILDLDDFKRVNDTYGHLQGDEVLRTVARILTSEPRAIDEAARYGGEEFVIALPETAMAGAVEIAERVRTRLESQPVAMVEGEGTLHVTASFGVATMPASATDVRELFRVADEALYEAKRDGKNRVVGAKARDGAFSSGKRR